MLLRCQLLVRLPVAADYSVEYGFSLLHMGIMELHQTQDIDMGVGAEGGGAFDTDCRGVTPCLQVGATALRLRHLWLRTGPMESIPVPALHALSPSCLQCHSRLDKTMLPGWYL